MSLSGVSSFLPITRGSFRRCLSSAAYYERYHLRKFDTKTCRSNCLPVSRRFNSRCSRPNIDAPIMDQARNLCTASKKAAVEDSMALDSANQCDSPSSPDANLITSVDETIGDIDMMDVFENLSDDDQEIAMAHQLAVETGERFYLDPASGKTVLTNLAHRLRGKCCGSACRHCAYKHSNVPAEKKGQKTFNGLFYA